MLKLPAFLPLPGIYEPSAIQQLPDGRFLVVEDEKQFPLSLFSIRSDGRVDSRPVMRDADDPLGKLDDLEGLTLDTAGHVYAITSHSRTGDGEEKKSRNKLLRFRIDDDRLVSGAVVTDLKPVLTATHPLLAEAGPATGFGPVGSRFSRGSGAASASSASGPGSNTVAFTSLSRRAESPVTT